MLKYKIPQIVTLTQFNAHVVGYQVEVVSKRWHNLIY